MTQFPAIFFPGTLCDERIWLPTWQALNMTYPSFVPLQWAETLEQMQALSQDRLAECDTKVHLVGYSMGGYIAALTALANPKQIQSLTLVSYDPAGLLKDEIAQRQQALKLPKNKITGLTQPIVQKFVAKNSQQFTSIFNLLKEMEKDLSISQLLHHYRATTERKNLVKKLAAAPFDVNLICGSEDHLSPKHSIEKSSKQLKPKHQTFVENCAHMLPLERPEVLAEFLKQIVLQ